MARHEHAHEFLGVAVALFAGDHDLVDILGVQVADRAFGERASSYTSVGAVDFRVRSRTVSQSLKRYSNRV